MRGVQIKGGAALTSPVPRRPTGLVVIATALCYVTDQLTKWWALSALPGRGRVALIGDLLGLRLIGNSGAAFSLGAGRTWIFTLISIVVVVVVARAARRVTSRAWALTFGLLLGGALGNLTDRMVREPGPGRGHVVDFIDYGWFIGNVADIWIVVAAVLLVLLTLLGVPTGPAPADPAGGADE